MLQRLRGWRGNDPYTIVKLSQMRIYLATFLLEHFTFVQLTQSLFRKIPSVTTTEFSFLKKHTCTYRHAAIHILWKRQLELELRCYQDFIYMDYGIANSKQKVRKFHI